MRGILGIRRIISLSVVLVGLAQASPVHVMASQAKLGEPRQVSDSAESPVESNPAVSPQVEDEHGYLSSSNPSKLEVHGFFSQAYATGTYLGNRFVGPDGAPPPPTYDEVTLGIPEGGTTNYRTLALQFRYQATPKDIVVVQLSSRALGESPIATLEDEVELDWAFYERRFGDSTSVKVGKVQIPFGIFNEVRDVGVILPFYRPAYVHYRDGAYTTETIDGVLLSHSFAEASDWGLDADVYYGGFDSVELDPFTLNALPQRAKDSYGIQLWLHTPVDGLGFIVGHQHREISGGDEGVTREVGSVTPFNEFYFSCDGDLGRFVVRYEGRRFRNDRSPAPVFGAEDFLLTATSQYWQVGYSWSEKFRTFAQYEVSVVEIDSMVFARSPKQDTRRDLGLALNYLFSPNLVLKAEYHDVAGEDLTLVPLVTQEGVLLDPRLRSLSHGSYTILSLSASF